jgi:peptidoglycan DL-endopeptidase CwlO
VPFCHRTHLPRVVAALTAVAAAATIGAATAAAVPRPVNSPDAATAPVDPKLSHRIGAVNAELDRLARQNDQMDEQYNLATAALTTAKRAASRAQQAADEAAARYRAAHARFLQAVLQQYVNGPTPSIGNLMTSTAPQQYLDDLTLADYMSSQFAATVRAEQATQTDAVQAKHRAAVTLAAARDKEAALAKRRTALQQQSQRFQHLLDTLTAQQQRERAHARAVAAAKARAELAAQQQRAAQQQAAQTTAPAPSAPRPVPGPVSGSVQQVIAFAEAQVGKAYSYGAAGPNAYDCSGLTMAAWAQAGVQLPHSAAEQYNYGTHVSYSQLQPGDLIFLYSPIGHVELYVGHDLAVSAADPSIGIVYVHPSQDMADYAGATRLTG